MTAYFAVVGNRDYIKFQGQRLPFWHFLDQQPDGWLCSLAYHRDDVPNTAPRIWDCGAWSYRNAPVPVLNGCDVTPSWALREYCRLAHAGDFVLAPDHMLIPGVDHDKRREFNHLSAIIFLGLAQRTEYRPMAAVHGLDVTEKVGRARVLYDIGYRALAMGGLAGMAGHKRALIVESVTAVRQAVPDVWLHVLGVSAPSYAAEWMRLGVNSFDGASHFKQAFTGGKFYYLEGDYLRPYRAARSGEEITAPACDCLACWKLRQDGIDTRMYGSNETNMGRAAHNLNQLMQAINVQRVRSKLFPLYCPTGQASDRETRQPRYCAGCKSFQRDMGWRCVWPDVSQEFNHSKDEGAAKVEEKVIQLEFAL